MGRQEEGTSSSSPPMVSDIMIEIEERAKRALGIALKGVKEVEGEQPLNVATKFFQEDLKYPLVHGLSEAYRVGRHVEGRDRILVVKFKESQERAKALRKRAALKGTSMFIEEDLTPQQQQERRQLVIQMKQARQEGKWAVIWNGRLVVKDAPPQPYTK
eukprot:c23120_g2_i1 orf=1058-1534(+)